MKSGSWGWVLLGSALLAGCATGGRNYQTDIDALNARVNALQGQLAAKDQELDKLQDQIKKQRSDRDAAQDALQKTKNDLAALQSQPKKTEPAKVYESDLK
jgi:chromosome segregation ATPase